MTRGREVWRQRWARNRAFWKLAYYLVGPRPESELCPLRWGDVIFPEDDRARFSGGQVAFTQTKLIGASDGTRTRDSQIHNLELYQLSYTRHRRKESGL